MGMENTETVIVRKGERGHYYIVVQHDQTGSAYDIHLSKEAYEQLRLHFIIDTFTAPKTPLTKSNITEIGFKKVDSDTYENGRLTVTFYNLETEKIAVFFRDKGEEPMFIKFIEKYSQLQLICAALLS